MLAPEFKSLLLTISITLKEMLIFILPIIVFFLVASSFANLSGGFLSFTGLLVLMVCLSNFTAVMFSYPVGMISKNIIASSASPSAEDIKLLPYFMLHIPKICTNTVALICAVISGSIVSARNSEIGKRFASSGAKIVNKFLSKVFTPLLPIFICGFIMKAQHERLLATLLKNFLPLLSVVLIVFAAYIGFLYFAISKFSFKRMLERVKNILPASIVGFSAMSSAAAMPVLLDGASKNAKDENVPKSIVSFIINTHMMGDALAIPLIAMSLYVVEYNALPDIGMYFAFAIGYVMAKFAAAGIPGGTIIIMTPVLESYLGFTSEMSSVILTIYLLFDPFCTMGSIFGNGVFCMIFERARNLIFVKQEEDTVQIEPESVK